MVANSQEARRDEITGEQTLPEIEQAAVSYTHLTLPTKRIV